MTKLLIPESPLMVLPRLAKRIGLNEAIVVQQIHYWLITSPTEKEGKKWIYNSYKEWHEQFPFWSVNTIGRIFRKLEEVKLITSKQMAVSGYDRTKWYTLNYQNELLDDTKMVHSIISEGDSLHYTETTTNIKEEDVAKIFTLFENNIQLLTPILADNIKTELTEGTSPKWIIDAIKISAENNVRKWNYIQAILDDWKKNGKNNKRKSNAKKSKQQLLEERLSAEPSERDKQVIAELKEEGVL